MNHTVTLGHWPIVVWMDGIPLFDGVFVGVAAAFIFTLIVMILLTVATKDRRISANDETVKCVERTRDIWRDRYYATHTLLRQMEVERDSTVECLDTTKGFLVEAQDKVEQLNKQLIDAKQWRKLDASLLRFARSQAQKTIAELNFDIAFQANMIESLQEANKRLLEEKKAVIREIDIARRIVADLVDSQRSALKQRDQERLVLAATRKDLSGSNTVINDIRDRLNEYASGEPWIVMENEKSLTCDA